MRLKITTWYEDLIRKKEEFILHKNHNLYFLKMDFGAGFNNMKLKNQYFIMRHGQTIYQTKKRSFIYPDKKNDNVLLTKEGIKQVEQSAKKLKKKKIDLIFASDFRRTQKTAKIVAKMIKQKIYLDKRLRDINLGVWHNKKEEDFYVEFPLLSRKLFYKKPEGGESWPDCRRRMRIFLREIDKKYKNKNILIISHGDSLWLLEGAVQGLTNNQLGDRKREVYVKTGGFKKLQ